MTRVRIIYSVEGWAYHNRALALQKYAPTGPEAEGSHPRRRGAFESLRRANLVTDAAVVRVPRTTLDTFECAGTGDRRGSATRWSGAGAWPAF